MNNPTFWANTTLSHYRIGFANDDALKLATVLRAALDSVNILKRLMWVGANSNVSIKIRILRAFSEQYAAKN